MIKTRVLIVMLLFVPLASASVMVSEVFYDTPGDDNVEEWVELYNDGVVVNLTNYTLADNNRFFVFPDGASIQNDSYLVVARNASGFYSLYGFSPGYDGMTLSFSNSGDEVTLRNSSNTTLDYVAWEDYAAGWSVKADTGKSIQRSGSVWLSDMEPTPGVGYSGGATSTTGSTSTTTTGTTSTTGTTTTTTDATSTTLVRETTTTILVETTTTLLAASTTTTLLQQTTTSTSTTQPSPTTTTYPKDILLTEVYYDTVGKDSEEEWVELMNNGNVTLNLSGYVIDNSKKVLCYPITPCLQRK